MGKNRGVVCSLEGVSVIDCWQPNVEIRTRSQDIGPAGWVDHAAADGEIFSSRMILLALEKIMFAFAHSTISVIVDETRMPLAA